jgi:DNA-binding IclR family transcriptional regulator
MTASARAGTQSIERAVLILKELATRGSFGWRLLDLSAQCELDRGTTHRILACLARARLVQQRPSDRRYIPGPLLFELSLARPGLSRFQAACNAPLTRVAKRLGAVALLHLRSGDEFVCAARVDHVEIKALTIEVGTRRPLIVSAGGVAILLALPTAEARKIIARNMQQVARFGRSRVRALRGMLRRSAAQGYGVSQADVVPGVSAVGVAISDSAGEPFGSISVVGLASGFPSARMPEVVAALREEAAVIARLALRLGL